MNGASTEPSSFHDQRVIDDHLNFLVFGVLFPERSGRSPAASHLSYLGFDLHRCGAFRGGKYCFFRTPWNEVSVNTLLFASLHIHEGHRGFLFLIICFSLRSGWDVGYVLFVLSFSLCIDTQHSSRGIHRFSFTEARLGHSINLPPFTVSI